LREVKGKRKEEQGLRMNPFYHTELPVRRGENGVECGRRLGGGEAWHREGRRKAYTSQASRKNSPVVLYKYGGGESLLGLR